LRITGALSPETDEVLTPEALAFILEISAKFQPRLSALLGERNVRRERISKHGIHGNDSINEEIRNQDWQVAPHPPQLLDRRVEITGPAEAKMAINALNSGAKVWLADLEDSSTPHWKNVINSQIVLKKVSAHTLSFENENGKEYRLNDLAETAQTIVRPRGLHMLERNVQVGGVPLPAAFFDAGLYLFHNHKQLALQGKAPFLYLPKLESEIEARLWNDFFVEAQANLGIPYGTIRSTVLIETITAAFKMEEILFELKDHVSGLNAGRWDYLFSIIKTFRDAGKEFILPDRDQVTMDAPFMKTYAQAMVHTCHKRGAMAIGGMAAFIPIKSDPELNAIALERVKKDKEREANQGFDGSWVAHPGLVDVCKNIFDSTLNGKPNQMARKTELPLRFPNSLIVLASENGSVTKTGLINNVDVSTRYLMAWLEGNGAVAIHNIMEDAATVEISRSQIWQQIKNSVKFADTGEICSKALVSNVIDEICRKLISETYPEPQVMQAADLLREISLAEAFSEFITTKASELIDIKKITLN
jgi:malate synthase